MMKETERKIGVLDHCTNAFGEKTDTLLTRRIKKYLAEPTPDRWDDIAGIIISQDLTTIWQAVVKSDPSFPQKGRTYDSGGHIIKDWATIPTPLQTLRAIKEALRAEGVLKPDTADKKKGEVLWVRG